MKKSRLGEFQELILMTVIVLQEEAYGMEIQRDLEVRLNERLSVGAIQTALKRMEEKGFLTSEWGEATQKRGGKRKRIYQATPYAQRVLREMKDIRAQLWNAMPELGMSKT
ncbi:MAG: helix-turn-helix transcriptional regulator [Bacteroidota bacterium]